MDYGMVQAVQSQGRDNPPLVLRASDGASGPGYLDFRHNLSTVFPFRESGLYAPSRVSPGL